MTANPELQRAINQSAINALFGEPTDYRLGRCVVYGGVLYVATESGWQPEHVDVERYPMETAMYPKTRLLGPGEQLYTDQYVGHFGGNPFTPRGKKWSPNIQFIAQFVKGKHAALYRLIVVFASKNNDRDPSEEGMLLCPGCEPEVFEFVVGLDELQKYDNSGRWRDIYAESAESADRVAAQRFVAPTYVIDHLVPRKELKSIDTMMSMNNFPPKYRHTLMGLYHKSSFRPEFGIKFGGTPVYCQLSKDDYPSSSHRLLFQYSECTEIPYRFGDSGIVRVWEKRTNKSPTDNKSEPTDNDSATTDNDSEPTDNDSEPTESAYDSDEYDFDKYPVHYDCY